MGCWNTIVVNDLPVWEEGWQKAQADLRRRSAFALSCAESELQLTLLQTQSGLPPTPAVVGVTGCGKRLTYVARPASRTSNDMVWTQDASSPQTGPTSGPAGAP